MLQNLQWILHVKKPELPVHQSPCSRPVLMSCCSRLIDSFLDPADTQEKLFLTFKTACRPALLSHEKGGCSVIKINKQIKNWFLKKLYKHWSSGEWKQGTLGSLHSFSFTIWSSLPKIKIKKTTYSSSVSFLLIHLDLHMCTNSRTLTLPNPPNWQLESELRTCSTVPWMMIFPTGISMPPRMATTAPNTAPAISPHLLLQQPMVVCLPFLPTVRLSLFSRLLDLLLSPSVFARVCSYVRLAYVQVPAAAAAQSSLHQPRSWQSSWGQVKVHTPPAGTQEVLRWRLYNHKAG